MEQSTARIKSLLRRAREEIKTDEDLVVLSILGSLIATFGLKLDNQYILIGAMIVAPFFDPIVSIAVFAFAGKLKDLFKSILSLLTVIGFSLVASMCLWLLISLGSDISTVQNLTPINVEYFYVAIILGGAGMFLWMWPKTTNTSAGISVAISLVPPLGALARSIIVSDLTGILQNLLMFATNVLGVIIGAMIVLLLRLKSEPE